jgi:hypothetical protein
MVRIVFDGENPKIRQGLRILLVCCVVQGIISKFAFGGIWIYTPYSLMSAIVIVGGALGNLVRQIVDMESDRKSQKERDEYVQAAAEKAIENYEKRKENERIRAKTNSADGTNG